LPRQAWIAQDAEGLQLFDPVAIHACRGSQLLDRHVQAGRRRGQVVLSAFARSRPPGSRLLVILMLEPLLDHFEWALLFTLHPLSVDVCAVEAPRIVDRKVPLLPPEFGMPARYGHVVQEDVTLRVPSGGRDVLVDQELRTRIGPTLNHKESLSQLKLALRDG